MQRFLRPSSLGLLLIAAGRAQAISVGEIDVRSHLGEPFNALIPVSIDEITLPQIDCFRLVGASRNHPDLANARVSLVTKGDRQYVSIVGTQPANDPVLDISLLAEGCGPTLRREYVVLLSPQEGTSPVSIQPPLIQATPPLAEAPPPPPRKKRSKKPTAALPASPSASLPYTLKRVPAHHVLRLDYGFDAFSQAAARIALKKQRAHLVSQAPQPASSETRPQDVLVLQGPSPDTGTTPGTVDTSLDGQGNANTAPASVAVAPSGNTASGPNQKSLPASGSAKDTSSRFAFSQLLTPINLLFLLLLPVLAIALALWLKARARKNSFSDHNDELAADYHDAPMESAPHPVATNLNEPAVDDIFGEPVSRSSLNPPSVLTSELPPPEYKPAKQPDADLSDSGHLPEFSSHDAFTVETTESPDHVLELAEVMLAFGRSGQAIETLRHYIRSQPRQGVEPWLKLLDLYRQSELREEFDSLSKDLHQCFNVAVPEWDSYPSHQANPNSPLGTTLSLESLPHIMGRLTAIWGQAECLSYLEKLLSDNRDGQRQGFALPIVREILILRDILRLNNPNPA